MCDHGFIRKLVRELGVRMLVTLSASANFETESQNRHQGLCGICCVYVDSFLVPYRILTSSIKMNIVEADQTRFCEKHKHPTYIICQTNIAKMKDRDPDQSTSAFFTKTSQALAFAIRFSALLRIALKQ